MQLFISWSGDTSRSVADALYRWIPKVLQAAEPWMSQNELAPGSRWSTELTGQLGVQQLGIACITPDNLSAPWMYFECGALSKLSTATLMPVLFKVAVADIQSTPLGQFQCKRLSARADVFAVMNTLDEMMEKPLGEVRLRETFERWWPDLEQELEAITASSEVDPEPVSSDPVVQLFEDVLVRLAEQTDISARTLRAVEDLRAALGKGETSVEAPNDLRVVAGAARRRLKAFPYNVGERVEHSFYGEGTVTAVRGAPPDMEVEVEFDAAAGTKRLSALIAPMRLVAFAPARDGEAEGDDEYEPSDYEERDYSDYEPDWEEPDEDYEPDEDELPDH